MFMIVCCFFFFNDTATTEIYTLSYTLSLHDALPISRRSPGPPPPRGAPGPPATGRSEEHTSELQSHSEISYAVFCLKKKNTHTHKTTTTSLLQQPKNRRQTNTQHTQKIKQ